MSVSVYQATRVTYDSAHGFAETQRRFDHHVPLLDPGAPSTSSSKEPVGSRCKAPSTPASDLAGSLP
jgi:hypothetical protein